MGNSMGKKRKMGIASSAKWHAPDVLPKKDGLSPLGRSYSMPMHHAKPKSDNYHVVALTSSTYGILKVDLPGDGDDGGRTSMSKNGPVEDSSMSFKDKSRKVDVPEVMVPKPWSDVEQVLSNLKPINDGKARGPEVPNHGEDGEPETINMWELMEGLDEDTRSPLCSDAAPVSPTPAVPKKVRSLETSISFSSIRAVREVDADFLEGAVKTQLKSAMESDTSVKGKFYTQSPSLGRASVGNLPPRHVSGKENAASTRAVQREKALSTLTPVKLNSTVNVPSSGIGDPKGNSSIKSLGDLSIIPSKAGVVVAAIERIESKTPVKLNGPFEPAPARTKSSLSSAPNSLLAPPLSGVSPRVAENPSSPQVAQQPKPENGYPRPFNLATSSLDDCDDQLPPESPLFDPELLASFQKAIEEVSEDEWYRVRRSEAGVASTSGSSSDGDSPLRAADNYSPSVLETSPLARKPEIDSNRRKMSFSKVAPVDFRDVVLQKVVRKVDPFEKFEKKCPPGGEDRVVVYVTSLRGIRKTFEDCSHMKLVIQGYRVAIDERDVSMHADFRQELKTLLGKPMPVPRLFIKGHYIGGAEEVSLLHEDGTLSKLLETMPTQTSWEQCEGCGDHRFVPCSECSGSCKIITEDDEVVRCTECNENGLIRCPICF